MIGRIYYNIVCIYYYYYVQSICAADEIIYDWRPGASGEARAAGGVYTRCVVGDNDDGDNDNDNELLYAVGILYDNIIMTAQKQRRDSSRI